MLEGFCCGCGCAIREVGCGDTLGKFAYRIVGGAGYCQCIRVVGVLHVGMSAACTGSSGAVGGYGILYTAYPPKEVVDSADSTTTRGVLNKPAVWIIAVFVRATIRINKLCEPPQVIIAGGSCHAGDALPALRREVSHTTEVGSFSTLYWNVFFSLG